jgi:hypothetical protein
MTDLTVVVVTCFALLACSERKPVASAPALAASMTVSASAQSAPIPSASVQSEDAGLASATPAPAPSRGVTPSASVSPAVSPAVRVTNIGMHIGGGPNDDVTKAPIAQSVAPHFALFQACYARDEQRRQGGDFGVDLLIEAKGGLAKVTHPRTTIASDAFRDCVVRVFEQVEFQKPKGGRTMVSYSLHFEPTQARK